jgi:hypothetical protein
MAEMIRAEGWLQGFLHSAWMPDWYLGDPTRVYYPPLTNWVLGLMTAGLGDVFLAYRVFVTGIVLLLGLSVFIVSYHWGGDAWTAVLGAVLLMTTPYTLRTLFYEGNFPRMLALLPFPWLIWLTERILIEKKICYAIALLAALWAFTVVAHVMQAAIFAVMVGIYVVLRVIIMHYIPLRRAVFSLMTIFLGVGLAGFYLLPAYGRMELSGVPYLPDSKIDLFSIRLDAFLPYHQIIEAVSLGSMLLLFTVFIGILVRKDHQRALLITGLVGIILALGDAGMLFRAVPLHTSMLPERFLNGSVILFALAIAATPKVEFRHRWLLLGCVLVLVVDFVPAARLIHMRAVPEDEYTLSNILAEHPLEGRVAPLIAPSPDSAQIYLMSKVGERENVFGWSLENTPHHRAVRRLINAGSRAPDYLSATLALWHADFIISRRDGLTALSQTPYRPIAEAGQYRLWERDTPSAFAHIIPRNQMLIAGENTTTWLYSFPFASEGHSPAIAAYDAGYLDHFSVIGLNRLVDPGRIEASLTDWVAAGGTLVMDLSGSQTAYEGGFSLF